MLAIHDRYFAASVLSPFADTIARRLARLSSGPVLEICAGSGTLTQAIASAMSAGLTIVATDPSAELLEHAALKPGLARIRWQMADPAALPFPDGAFGIVTCHVGVATLTNRVQAFREARRVMKRGGRLGFSVLGHIRQNPVAECLQNQFCEVFPADPPRYLGYGLHGYTDNEVIDDDLTNAGFTDAVYTTIECSFAAASARDVAIGYCLGTPLRSELDQRTAGDPESAVSAAEQALRKEFGPGPIESTIRGYFVTASG